jgi:hypothetical protein
MRLKDPICLQNICRIFERLNNLEGRASSPIPLFFLYIICATTFNIYKSYKIYQLVRNGSEKTGSKKNSE